MSNKIESIIILFGILSVLVGISIHLFRKSSQYKREANDEYNKSLESTSTIKSKIKEDTISEQSVKLRGTLESSKDKRDQPKKKAKP